MIGRLFKNDGVLFVLAFVIDRVTKYLVLAHCKTPCQINQFLNFNLTLNRGISWGMLNAHDDTMFFIVSGIIVLITVGLACYTFVRWMNYESIVGEVLVLAGSLSNIIDRILYNGVVDFILLSYDDWSFPIFNIADVCIVFGVGLMAVELYKK